MKGLFDAVVKFLFLMMGLILISAFVGMFSNGIDSRFIKFVENIKMISLSLVNPSSLVVMGPTGFEYSIFPQFWGYYLYSVTILILALILSIILGILLTYIVLILPDRARRLITSISSLFESTPDLLIIMAIQFAILLFYKKTGILLFSIAGTSQTRTYVIPILVLSLIPAIMIFRVILLLSMDEMEKQYVDLVRSKGYGKSFIYFVHVLRNITPSIFTHSKSIIFFMLSSMVIFERLFNINGIITFILRFPEPNVIAFTLIFISLPIFSLYAFLSMFTERKTGYRLEW